MRAALSWLLCLSNDTAYKSGLALKINLFYFMSIGKNNEEIKEEISFSD